MRRLVGGHVYDAEHADFRRADIGHDGDRITHVGIAPGALHDDDVLDLEHAWLLPGPIDCHVHLTQPTDAGDPAKASARSDAASRSTATRSTTSTSSRASSPGRVIRNDR